LTGCPLTAAATHCRPRRISGKTTSGCVLTRRRCGAIEIDDRAREVYRANHPEVAFLGNDIRDADPLEIMRRMRLRPGQLDLLAGCPPCQGFSRIRRKNRRGAKADERNMLIDNFAAIVETLRPKNLMLENLPGLADYPRFRAFKKGADQWCLSRTEEPRSGEGVPKNPDLSTKATTGSTILPKKSVRTRRVPCRSTGWRPHHLRRPRADPAFSF
jgi:C-5 cytosine-specific DNA methylase